MADRIVKKYKCAKKELPETLWRVQYDDNSLEARAEPDFADKAEFKTAVEQHLDWKQREPTPFVSAFVDGDHAVNWARRLGDNHHSLKLVEIQAARLGPIFSVGALVPRLHIVTQSNYEDEYLILRRIRKRSVVHSTDI